MKFNVNALAPFSRFSQALFSDAIQVYLFLFCVKRDIRRSRACYKSLKHVRNRIETRNIAKRTTKFHRLPDNLIHSQPALVLSYDSFHNHSLNILFLYFTYVRRDINRIVRHLSALFNELHRLSFRINNII